MIIRLHEIPKEGKSYHLDRTTGELNEVLEDLIGSQSYETDFQLLPVGQAFDLKGKVKTSLKETCSFCGEEFELPVAERFHELILKDEAKKLTGLKDFSPDSDVSVSVAGDGLTYDVGQFLHEIIALAEPYQPICKEGCKGLCGTCGKNLNEGDCRCAKEKSDPTSPFSVLKKLKLN
ncbi:MAG TPA: DUF177 domain-containing protein [Bdellovibrionales bacterium]|nr:DUF177 domain-containing protein [Bdellovibrionales bacterium]